MRVREARTISWGAMADNWIKKWKARLYKRAAPALRNPEIVLMANDSKAFNKPISWWLRYLRVLAVVIFLLVALSASCLYYLLTVGLPKLDGVLSVTGVVNAVQLHRDNQGILTVEGQTRADVAFGLGYAHAQDRFFQMDLLRRSAAGELSGLFGEVTLPMDRKSRRHRFRALAERVVADASADDRSVLEAYVAGVNSAQAKPFEYGLLGVAPKPWTTPDSVLVLLAMFLALQDDDFRQESALGLTHDILPSSVYALIAAPGTAWDAPLQGSAMRLPPLPHREAFDLRRELGKITHRPPDLSVLDALDGLSIGSNNWAVAGKHTSHGGALVANDMHLQLEVPNIWYRAELIYPDEGAKEKKRHIVGATLPGLPTIIVGSNREVAWGLTNSEGDWSDLVTLEPGATTDTYKTPTGEEFYTRHTETIEVKDSDAVVEEVVWTHWGPVWDADHRGRKRALRWVAHDRAGVNLGFLRLMEARNLEELCDAANNAGSPHLNIVAGDTRGDIAWTLLGRVPRRVGFDGRLPGTWADATRHWDGYLSKDEYPRILRPASGRLWTANNRVVEGADLTKLGFGGYDLGARAMQIRDRLMTLEKATESDMLALQRDNRALFYARWQKLLLDVLTIETARPNSPWRELQNTVENWGETASIHSVGFRVVFEFRRRVHRLVLESLTANCRIADADFRYTDLPPQEGLVWAILEQRPFHLLDPNYDNWHALLRAAVHEVFIDLTKDGKPLASKTWGEANRSRIRHPLSRASTLLGWLDMPIRPLPGAWAHMPAIQRPDAGASQRMAVSPGREEFGFFHMPCGQSGHPFSPHYRDSHEAWMTGKATPFLAGPTRHTLTLKPTR